MVKQYRTSFSLGIWEIWPARLLVWSLVMTLALALSAHSAWGERTWQLGDKVEGYNVGWYKGTIVEIGSGEHQGYYLIQWDEFDSKQWVKASDIRDSSPSTSQGDDNESLTLKMGAYRCGVFLSGKYTPTMRFTLNANGSYQRSSGSSGQYRFGEAAQRLTFLSGPLKGMIGRVEAEPERRRVIIRLNKSQDLSGSEHSQNWKSQYCSPVK